ncbi:MAG: PKD domain-containing protein [Ferruginibacter sp.]
MKKLLTTLALFSAILFFRGYAQTNTTGCNPDFTFQFLSGFTVKFNPAITTDSPYVQHSWSFCDGTLMSNRISPTHSYASNGVYTVKHKISRYLPGTNYVCTDSLTRVVTIAQATCNLNASFYFVATATNPFTHSYFNTSANFAPGDSIRWTFGDGTFSYAQNPTHTFANAGIYNVCLRVKKQTISSTIPCVSEICKLDTVGIACNIQAYFTNTTVASTTSSTIQFTNQSVGAVAADSAIWTFGDGTTSTLPNPTHTYTNVGTYTVCLKIKRNSSSAGLPPCQNTYCKTVVISPVTPSCTLTANFTSYRDSLVTVPYTYHFTNTSSPLSSTDSVRWTFGDGTTSSQLNPNHSYAQPGTYNVCLRVIKRNPNGVLTTCVREVCRVLNVVAINSCNVQAYFSFLAATSQPTLIQFTNQSPGYLPTDSITWNFGDSTSSHDANPTHIFTTGGTFTVCLTIVRHTATGAVPCVRQYCKVVTIAQPCTLVANFTWSHDSTGVNIYNYRFNNTSAPLSSTDSIRWTFGDGTSSNQVNPNHAYAQPGTYTVCLRVIKRTASGTLSNCVAEKCYTITIQQLCTIQANYSRTVSTSNYKTIYFTNTSNATPNNATATWYFGDSSTATTWNATHTYNQQGSYNVCLRVQSGTCVSYKCDSVRIIEPTPPCAAQSNYSFVRSTTNNNIITFTPAYIDSAVQYTWTFGDSTGSQTAVTPTHQFTAIGYYTVCLTAYRSATCVSTTCKTIYVSSITNCSNISLSFADVRNPLVPNRVTFVATSNTAITDQLWTITKLPTTAGTGGITTIHSNNPTYLFLDSGYYNVCLKTTHTGGCVRDVCRVIRITQQMPTATICNLQVYPNPATSVANVSITLVQPTSLYAYVYNNLNMLVAQKVQPGFVGTNTVSVVTANLPSGIYRFKLVHGTSVCNATFVK